MKHRKTASNSPTKSGKGANARGCGKGKTASSMDLKDLNLRLPQIQAEDHDQWVPRYHSVLKRQESDGVGLEDLDTLQMELEAMLASVVVKANTLEEEITTLSNINTKTGVKRGPSSPPAMASSAKKKFHPAASTSSGGAASSGKPVIGLPKVKSEQALPKFDPLENEQIRPEESPKITLPKNETPSRFWAFVEPYCAPISVEDVKLLEDLIKTHTDMSEYFRVPPLGQHYTSRWAKEDLENERQKSSTNNSSDENSVAANKMLNKAANGSSNNKDGDEESPFGDLTQRLVGGLMEENIMTNIEDSVDSNKGKGSSGDHAAGDDSKNNLIKSLNVTNSEALEARLKKELEEQGLLSPDGEDQESDNQDEILEELKRCQNELKAVSAHNAAQLKRLLKSAKEEMIRQEMRNRLEHADKEVMDAYQKISAARSKKKTPTKKERDNAWKALKERQIILQEMDQI